MSPAHTAAGSLHSAAGAACRKWFAATGHAG